LDLIGVVLVIGCLPDRGLLVYILFGCYFDRVWSVSFIMILVFFSDLMYSLFLGSSAFVFALGFLDEGLSRSISIRRKQGVVCHGCWFLYWRSHGFQDFAFLCIARALTILA